MDFTWRCLAHIYQFPDTGDYIMINERTYREFLFDEDLIEFDRDFAEVDAFEAPLFEQGSLFSLEDIRENLPLPNGSTTGDQVTGYTIKFRAEGPGWPDHLIHPHYRKWALRIKDDPNIVSFRLSHWVE